MPFAACHRLPALTGGEDRTTSSASLMRGCKFFKKILQKSLCFDILFYIFILVQNKKLDAPEITLLSSGIELICIVYDFISFFGL